MDGGRVMSPHQDIVLGMLLVDRWTSYCVSVNCLPHPYYTVLKELPRISLQRECIFVIAYFRWKIHVLIT